MTETTLSLEEQLESKREERLALEKELEEQEELEEQHEPIAKVKPKKRRIFSPAIEWLLTHCHIRKYPLKSTVIFGGEKAETLFFIVRGSVAVMAKEKDGREMILSYLSTGEFFGESGLFETDPERTAWVETRENCDIAECSYKKFKQLLHINPEVLVELTTQLSLRLKNTSKQVTNLAFLDVAGRIAKTLLHLSEQPTAMSHPEGKQIRITRQELGQMAGCSRETVGRVLKLLEDDNIIAAHGKNIVVYEKGLEKILE